MLAIKITPLTVQQYAEISEDIYDETHRVEYAGMTAGKCIGHPEYGDIILISSTLGGCLMIHFEPAHPYIRGCTKAIEHAGERGAGDHVLF